jgi:hypothetical protein
VPDFYKLVPKSIEHNIAWRRQLIERAASDESLRADLWNMCRDDMLFYINTFLWTYDPRLIEHPAVPFVTYNFQDDVFIQMRESMGKEDVLIKKSRDMGASWMLVTLFEWRWHFYSDQSFLLASRNEALVDKSGDPKSLMWKIDFLHRHLPTWLRPKTSRIKLHIKNLNNNSTIDGEATTPEIARGARLTAIGLDEFAFVDDGHAVDAATLHATNCRFFNSTSNGTATAFKSLEDKLPSKQKIYLIWTLHPEKARGSYTSRNGRSDILDTDYVFPDDYPFILDGKQRSPWYDLTCRRASHRQQIAREVDMDDTGSQSPVFDTAVLERMKPGLRPPFVQGRLMVDPVELKCEFQKSDGGPMKLWELVDVHGELPRLDRYVVGCDISAGTGGEYSSNSVAQVINVNRGAVVATYASNTISAVDFASLAISLCKWFNGAYLNWDTMGPMGITFRNEIIRLGYSNIYFGSVAEVVYKEKTRKPGYHSKKGTAAALMYELQRVFDSGELILYDLDTLNECGHWRFKGDDVEYAPSAETPDESAKGRLHGDRVMALGVAWMAVRDRPPKTKPSKSLDWKNTDWRELPVGTMASRMRRLEQEKSALQESEWDW